MMFNTLARVPDRDRRAALPDEVGASVTQQ